MAERSILPTVLGVPPYAAVGLAAGLTALGVLVDLTRIGSLGSIFTVCYLGGCLLATAWVRRSGLFGPMVAPPLLLAMAVPTVVLLADDPKPGAGIGEQLLVIGAPLVNSFPTMAWTTALVVGFGAARLYLQRIPATPPKPARPATAGRTTAGRTTAGRTTAGRTTAAGPEAPVSRPPGPSPAAAARAATRRSGSPPPS